MGKLVSTLREQARVLRDLATMLIDGDDTGIRGRLLVLAKECENLAEVYEKSLTKGGAEPSDDG